MQFFAVLGPVWTSLLWTSPEPSKTGHDQTKSMSMILNCHDQFLLVSHGFKEGLRVDGAASHRGCRGCAATRHRGEWMQECPMCGKVPRRVHEVFSTGFGSEASKLSFMQKRWSWSKALNVVVHPLHEPSLVRLREERSLWEVSIVNI